MIKSTVLTAALAMTCVGLQAQTMPFITLADGPFSPGGFNNIGSATATTLLDSRNGLLTIEVDPATPQVVDVLNSYSAINDSHFHINFSFLNVDRGIPLTFFGRAYNFLRRCFRVGISISLSR